MPTDTAIASATPPIQTDTRSTATLISTYSLDGGSASDGLGGVHGTVAGTWSSTSAASLVTGVSGTSMYKKGGSAHITLPSGRSVHTLSEMSLDVYYQPSGHTTKHTIMAWGSGSSAGDASLECLTNGRLRAWHVGEDGVLRFFESTDGIAGTNLVVGTACRITLTFGAAGARLYLNGTQVAGIPENKNGWNNSATKYIGVWTDGLQSPMEGAVDHLRIWDGQLSPAEVADLPAPTSITLASLNDDDPWSRDSFWESEGYSRVFFATPRPSDVGGNVRSWFHDVWSNGFELTNYLTGPGSVAIERAPDGSPCVRVTVPQADDHQDASFFARGQQLGTAGSAEHAVFAVEVWTEGYAPNGSTGTYHGVGHHWGAEPHETNMPGGSINPGRAWSIRAVSSISNTWSIYVYPDGNEGKGKSHHSSVKPANGAWQLIELEVVQNTAGSSNGRLRMYQNGTMIKEMNNFAVRLDPNIRPRGLGCFVKRNGPNNSAEIYRLRNWKIYTRD